MCCSVPAGMQFTEQELACLHVDLLMLLYRMELAVGLEEQARLAAGRRSQLLAAAERRDAQATIFGERTLHERRQDAAMAIEAGRLPAHPEVRPQLAGLTMPGLTSAGPKHQCTSSVITTLAIPPDLSMHPLACQCRQRSTSCWQRASRMDTSAPCCYCRWRSCGLTHTSREHCCRW